MDDIEVCPLCCEELDISDQQFFPCKCGYQVCMWCWHRIKEQETGLCPACRTPYGDDPHEFSAVDMEEVLKANKEKAAAEKREKERLRLSQTATAAAGVAAMHIGGGSDGDSAVVSSSGSRPQLEPPKDRNQLANMRVIRRNLVYSVGLPPSIVTEDILKKAEYFGQYGKIAKIVVNRNHATSGDPKRASASAYVTFVYPEDALACILALDGFYMDGRNIRVSFGTSKYCSAFIKNVKCNNPDCTYLHCMGDSEDTFTKQEIQAGYVTSGRDVLARQQQLAAASAGPNPRRRIGSPSGTGKMTSNPIFPQPTYDEPSRLNAANTAPVGPPATNSTTQFPAIGAAASMHRTASVNIPISAASKPIRASSLPIFGDSSVPPNEISSRQQEELRKQHAQSDIGSRNFISLGSEEAFETISSAPNIAPTAASVLTGVHTTSRPSQATPNATLTALTPLTRSKSLIEKKDSSKLTSLRSSSLAQPSMGAPFSSDTGANIGSIGGDVIGSKIGRIGNHLGSIGGSVVENNAFRGQGNGDFSNNSSSFGGSSLLFGGLDDQSKTSDGSDLLFHPSVNDRGSIGGGNGIWDDNRIFSSFSNDVLSGSPLKLSDSSSRGTIRNSFNTGTSGSSALASMLGIELPSGAGSLRETLWASSTPLNPPNNEAKSHIPAPIGSGIKKTNDNVIIGGPTRGGLGIPIGGFGPSTSSNVGNKSDIALLQSLLPGVHITSSSSTFQSTQNVNNSHSPFAGSGWGGLSGSGFSSQNEMLQQQVGGDSWGVGRNGNSNNGLYSTAPVSQNQNNNKKQGPVW